MFTKENAARYIPLLQALAQGKTIQYRGTGFVGDWVDITGGLNFDDEAGCYRIKPEPRVVWIRGTEVCEDCEMDHGNYSEIHLNRLGWYKFIQSIK